MKIVAQSRLGNYPIEIGIGQTGRLQALLKRIVGPGRLILVCDAQWYALHGSRFQDRVGFPGKRIVPVILPRGERAKSVRVLNEVYDYLLRERIQRSDFLLACGGGVTSDLSGYVAATILRGIPWGVLPTTMVGMVDAAIGGKTGINHPVGKNLIGAFWPPKFVWIDLEYLQTVPHRHMVAGLGELVKSAGLAGGTLLKETVSFVERGELYDFGQLAPLVRQAARYKAKVVSRDERDNGVRQQLNFGHTVGHGIEYALGYRGLLHGEAVILGMEAALLIGELAGIANSPQLAKFAEVVDRCLGLVPRRKIDPRAVLEGMKADKKRSGNGNRFVLIERPGRVGYVDGVPTALVREAVEKMVAKYRQTGGRRG